MKHFKLSLFGATALAIAGLSPSPAYAACTTPAAVAGSFDYDTVTNTYRYCNDTIWVTVGGGSATVTYPLDADAATSPAGQIVSINSGANNFLYYNVAKSNTTLGEEAGDGLAASSGSRNSFFGNIAGRDTTTGSNNTFLGEWAGSSNTTGSDNLYAGVRAGGALENGSSNVFLGRRAGEYATASNNVLIGYESGKAASANPLTGTDNTFVGYQTGLVNTSGEANTFIGDLAGTANTTGNYNTFIGSDVGIANTTGSWNTYLGEFAGRNSTGQRNTFIGSATGTNSASGNNNTFVARDAGLYATADNNTLIGYQAGMAASGSELTGTDNTFVGYQTGLVNTSGYQNTFIGDSAGLSSTTARENTFVGAAAGDNTTTGSSNIIIGADTQNLTATTDDYLNIGDSITGNMATGNIAIVGTASLAVPSGTTAQRPSTGVNGMVRYNSTTNKLETYENSAWANVLGGGVTYPLDVEGVTTIMEIGTGSISVMVNDGANQNFFAGQAAGTGNTGNSNTFIGTNSGGGNSSADANTALGTNTLLATDAGENNTAIGNDALRTNTDGSDNVAIGYNAGDLNTTGERNILIGSDTDAPTATTSDYLNIGNAITGTMDSATPFDSSAITIAGNLTVTGTCTGCAGAPSLPLDADAATSPAGQIISINSGANNFLYYNVAKSNTTLGEEAGDGLAASSGSRNSFFGNIAGRDTTTGSNNTFLGEWAGSSNTTGSDNLYAGVRAGGGLENGSSNVFLGRRAGEYATASNNVFIGYESGKAASANPLTGTDNTFVGYQTGLVNTSGDDNVFIGDYAGRANTTGTDNTFIGSGAGSNNTTGSANIAIGQGALSEAGITATGNVAIGYLSAGGNSSSASVTDSTLLGYYAGKAGTGDNLTLTDATLIGYSAGGGGNSGDKTIVRSIFIGHNAGTPGTGETLSAAEMVAIGDDVLDGNTTLQQGVVIGYQAGDLLNGNNNTFVGYRSGNSVTTGTDNLLLGHDVDTPTATTSNYLNIGNAITGTMDSATPFDSSSITIAGDLGIGTSTPETDLDIHQPAGAFPNMSLTAGDITLPDYSGSSSVGVGSGSNAFGHMMANRGTNGTTSTGGLKIQGFTESGVTDWIPLYLVGTHGSSTTQTLPAVAIAGQSHNGSNNRAALTGTEPILDVYNTYTQALTNPTNLLLRIQADGNLGLGTTAPAEKLTVIGGQLMIDDDDTSPTTKGCIRFDDTSSKLQYSHDCSSYLEVGTATAGLPIDVDGVDIPMIDATGINFMVANDTADIVALGKYAGQAAGNDDIDNTFMGDSAGRYISDGDYNTMIGSKTGFSATTTSVSNVTTLGYSAGNGGLTANGTTLVGSTAGDAGITGTGNTAVGFGAAGSTIDGQYTTSIGYEAGLANISSDWNVMVGYRTGYNSTGGQNTFVGGHAGLTNTTGDNNTFIGGAAGENNDTGSRNTSIGQYSAFNNDSGEDNTFIGRSAGANNISGSRNIMIGSTIDSPGSTTDDYLNIGNAIYGVMDTNGTSAVGDDEAAIIIDGHLSIGTSAAPADVLNVGTADMFMELSTTTNTDVDPYNLGMGGTSGDELRRFTISSQWGATLQALQFGDAAIGTETIFGIASSNDSGASWNPNFTVSHGGDIAVGNDITYVGTITDVSDKRLKDNIKPLNADGGLLDRISQIDTYSFTMKSDKTRLKEFGVMAQELETIFPELVHTANDEIGTKSVNYVGLIAPMIEATKELKAENESLKNEVNTLKASHDTTHAKLEALSENVALLNKYTGNNVGKASLANYWLILLGFLAGLSIMFTTQRVRQNR